MTNDVEYPVRHHGKCADIIVKSPEAPVFPPAQQGKRFIECLSFFYARNTHILSLICERNYSAVAALPVDEPASVIDRSGQSGVKVCCLCLYSLGRGHNAVVSSFISSFQQVKIIVLVLSVSYPRAYEVKHRIYSRFCTDVGMYGAPKTVSDDCDRKAVLCLPYVTVVLTHSAFLIKMVCSYGRNLVIACHMRSCP